jgi:chitin synthase
MWKHLKIQKYLLMAGIAIVNTVTTTFFLLYPQRWYAFLPLLAPSSLLNSASALLIYGQKMLKPAAKPTVRYRKEGDGRRYLYVMPCYNESRAELVQALDALVDQRTVVGDRRAVIIVCDGLETTAAILADLLSPTEESLDGDGQSLSSRSSRQKEPPPPLTYSYVPWDGFTNTLTISQGYYQHKHRHLPPGTSPLPCLVVVKGRNIGKRDSLTLMRTVCYLYNRWLNAEVALSLATHGRWQHDMVVHLSVLYDDQPIAYLIGLDADTVFDYECSYELILGIEQDPAIQACVGYVDLLFSPTTPAWRFWSLFQYAEYMQAQCLRRYAQSQLTGKVNCLSGCNQIMRISAETCGPAVMDVFNRKPPPHENLFQHIRSYASEDRNHVCHLLSQFPDTRTTQCLTAVAYTTVPNTAAVFFSQRRRWTLGAAVNDLLLVYLPGINICERIAAIINLLTLIFAPFIAVATAVLVQTVVLVPQTDLFYYLCIPIAIPIAYSVLLPVFIKPLPSFGAALYFYVARLVHLALGSLVNLGIFFYALAYMDLLTWGKTRQLSVATEEPVHKTVVVDVALAIAVAKAMDEAEPSAPLRMPLRVPPLSCSPSYYSLTRESQSPTQVPFSDSQSVKSYILGNGSPFTGVDIVHIGVCGYGFVGQAVVAYLQSFGYRLTIYDKYHDQYHPFADLFLCDLIYLCLPTLYNDTLGTYDMTEVDSVLKALATADYKGLILLKSTVLPTYCTTMTTQYPSLRRLVHNPEFLTARTAAHDFANQTHIVLGYALMPTTPNDDPNDDPIILDRFYRALFPQATISHTTADTAALVKLGCNCFYATKIQFFTELYGLCQHLGVDHNDVVRLMLQNGWIAPHHTQVPGPDGLVSYGGLCFPKDMAALSSMLKRFKLPGLVIEAATREQRIMR